MQARIFNENGIEYFKDILQQIKEGEINEIPKDLINSTSYTLPFEENIDFDLRLFTSKKEITIYLHDKLDNLERAKIHYNTHLWSWLSAFYFDSVCPINKNNERKVGALVRHVLNIEDWNRYYRHLLASSFRLYDELGDLAEIYLSGKSYEFGEHLEQLASQQKFATSRGVVEAATILYWDKKNSKIKKNARDKIGPGIIRRFTIDILNQFDLTYDLNSMSGEEIIALLPDEFNEWK